jgi:antitoxin component of MazEF toxin-antitoxin module
MDLSKPMAFHIIVLAFTILLCSPGEALAWGIGFHLQIGSQILANIERIAPHLASLLQAFPNDYLYGCISADITLGKKFTHYLRHCHSWRVARQLIRAADTDPRKACAYGYLSHLAMDTVAHAYFVPYKTVRTFNSMTLKHACWEMRLEAEINPEIWSLARSIARKDFSSNDAMLRSIIADTLFSFGTNKRLFNSLLLLNHLQQWQKMLRSINNNSKWVISPADREEYFTLARQVTESILAEMEQSRFWKADPAGERALYAAGMIRKNLNLLWLDGKLSKDEAERIVSDLKPRFREAITAPDQLLELLSAF